MRRSSARSLGCRLYKIGSLLSDRVVAESHAIRISGLSLRYIIEVTLIGSEQEFGKMRILRCFLKNKEFGLGSRQALRLQEQVVHVAIATAAPEQGFEVAVDRFDHSQRYLHPAVVQDALQVIQ